MSLGGLGSGPFFRFRDGKLLTCAALVTQTVPTAEVAAKARATASGVEHPPDKAWHSLALPHPQTRRMER